MTAPVALVTGSARGIGLATAKLFTAKGYRVVIADLDADAAADAVNFNAGETSLQIDVTSAEDARDAIATTLDWMGRLDVLVNNAGIGDNHLPTLEQELGHFRKVLDVHLTGTFLLSQAAVPAMCDGGGGAIVNLSSIAGISGLPRRNAYGAAKAGIAQMTKSMACEWAGLGIRVNAVAPGYTATELVRKLEADGRIDRARIARRIPMGRLAEPEEIAEAIVFLASPAARYITGSVLSVDGGWTAFGDFGDASAPDE
ncbi:MAG: SDR family oxidoreductase [Oricola sp.]